MKLEVIYALKLLSVFIERVCTTDLILVYEKGGSKCSKFSLGVFVYTSAMACPLL